MLSALGLAGCQTDDTGARLRTALTAPDIMMVEAQLVEGDDDEFGYAPASMTGGPGPAVDQDDERAPESAAPSGTAAAKGPPKDSLQDPLDPAFGTWDKEIPEDPDDESMLAHGGPELPDPLGAPELPDSPPPDASDQSPTPIPIPALEAPDEPDGSPFSPAGSGAAAEPQAPADGQEDEGESAEALAASLKGSARPDEVGAASAAEPPPAPTVAAADATFQPISGGTGNPAPESWDQDAEEATADHDESQVRILAEIVDSSHANGQDPGDPVDQSSAGATGPSISLEDEDSLEKWPLLAAAVIPSATEDASENKSPIESIDTLDSTTHPGIRDVGHGRSALLATARAATPEAAPIARMPIPLPVKDHESTRPARGQEAAPKPKAPTPLVRVALAEAPAAKAPPAAKPRRHRHRETPRQTGKLASAAVTAGIIIETVAKQDTVATGSVVPGPVVLGYDLASLNDDKPAFRSARPVKDSEQPSPRQPVGGPSPDLPPRLSAEIKPMKQPKGGKRSGPTTGQA